MTPPDDPTTTKGQPAEIVRLAAWRARARAGHAETRVLGNVPLRHLDRPHGFDRFFRLGYAALRELRAEHAGAGVALLALDRELGQVAATSWLSVMAGSASPDVAVLGRHEHAHLRLADDPELSLRHALALAVPPDCADGYPALRLIDLRTHAGLVDETGHDRESFWTSVPLVVYAGLYALVVVPLRARDTPAPLPNDTLAALMRARERRELPSDAALQVPRWLRAGSPPVRVAGLVGPGSSAHARPPERPAPVRTLSGITVFEPPLCAPGETPFGNLEVSAAGELHVVPVGLSALARGVLLGRSERCALAHACSDDHISRCHALVFVRGDDVLIADLASENGTYLVEEGGLSAIECVVLRREVRVCLATDGTRVQFRPAR